MFVKKADFGNAIQKVRLEIGTLVGKQEDAEAYIELKEMPTFAVMKMKEATASQVKTMEVFKEILPEIIVDHNFYEDENNKWSNSELTEFIYSKLSLTLKVIEGYTKASFFSPTPQREDR